MHVKALHSDDAINLLVCHHDCSKFYITHCCTNYWKVINSENQLDNIHVL